MASRVWEGKGINIPSYLDEILNHSNVAETSIHLFVRRGSPASEGADRLGALGILSEFVDVLA